MPPTHGQCRSLSTEGMSSTAMPAAAMVGRTALRASLGARCCDCPRGGPIGWTVASFRKPWPTGTPQGGGYNKLPRGIGAKYLVHAGVFLGGSYVRRCVTLHERVRGSSLHTMAGSPPAAL
jgi:hypothetical protein